MKRWYEEAGFVDVQEKIIRMPMNQWPRDRHAKALGKMSEANLLAGLGAFTMGPFSRVFGWNMTEIEVRVNQSRLSNH